MAPAASAAGLPSAVPARLDVSLRQRRAGVSAGPVRGNDACHSSSDIRAAGRQHVGGPSALNAVLIGEIHPVPTRIAPAGGKSFRQWRRPSAMPVSL